MKIAASIIITLFSVVAPALGQTVPTPAPKPAVVVQSPARPSEVPAEKSISVANRVSVTLCVGAGNVRINGWDRSEVRALVRGGGNVGFRVAERDPDSQRPVWVFVIGGEFRDGVPLKSDECLKGSDIEVDVPREAVVSLESRRSETTIESVGRVRVRNVSGNIILNGIANGIDAINYEGGIIAGASSGPIALTTTSGSIVAYDLRQREPGDVFRAKTTSGAVNLQSIGHRQIQTNTISGATTYTGPLLAGAQYGFDTQIGQIRITVPSDSSCRLSAWFGFGRFDSQIPLSSTVKGDQTLTGQLGKTDSGCAVFLKTTMGAVQVVGSGK